MQYHSRGCAVTPNIIIAVITCGNRITAVPILTITTQSQMGYWFFIAVFTSNILINIPSQASSFVSCIYNYMFPFTVLLVAPLVAPQWFSWSNCVASLFPALSNLLQNFQTSKPNRFCSVNLFHIVLTQLIWTWFKHLLQSSHVPDSFCIAVLLEV